jgi:DNA repair and recombination protein RAD52
MSSSSGPPKQVYQGAAANEAAGSSGQTYTEEERDKIQRLLQQRLPADEMAQRAGPGNQKLTYIESWKSIEMANEIFGFNGWSCSVLTLDLDFLDEVKGRWSCGASAIVQVKLKDGTSHEDVGYGQSDNLKDRAKCLEKAKKVNPPFTLAYCSNLTPSACFIPSRARCLMQESVPSEYLVSILEIASTIRNT